jgi:hypothetical protein
MRLLTKYFVMLVVLNLLNLATFKLSAQDTQRTSVEGDYIEVSQELFDQLKDWQNNREKQLPLNEFLATKNVAKNMQQKVTRLLKELRGSDGGDRESDCNCSVVTVNSSYDVAPSLYNQFSPPENQGGLTTWYAESILGTATRQRLKLNSPSTNNQYEYGKSVSGDEISSNSYARMSFNYICTNGSLLPEDCGCSKNIYLRAKYYSSSWVSTSASGGWGTHSCFSAVEDDVALFTIDQYLTDTQVTVLKGGQFQLSRAQDDTWNPEFWMNIVDLASSIAGVVEDFDGGIDWSDTIADVGGQIVTVFQTPVDIHYQEEEDGSENGSFSMSYDGGITLEPNHILTVSMISKGYIYGKGDGKFVSDSEHKSDYFISAVLPFDDSNPECCMEKYGKWVSGSLGVQGTTGLRNSIGAHQTLWAPWDNLTDTTGDGNVNVTTSIGYAIQADQCIICGIDPITGLSVRATGLNLGTNTRPAHLSWDGQMYVSSYEVKVYNSSGVLIYTFTTTDTTFTVNLPPGNYSFSVRAICENGTSMLSDLFNFNVKELYAVSDPVRFKMSPNPGKENVEIKVENYREFSTLQLEITDVRGLPYYNGEIKDGLHNINVQRWPTGIYFCKITDGKQVVVKQLIKD